MKKMLTSCFGLGLLPVAPGTWGSIPPAIVFALLCQFGAPPLSISILMAILVVAGAIVCVKLAPEAIAAAGKRDPREVVADEFAGQAVTFLTIPLIVPTELGAARMWVIAGIGFLLFRIFDIAKPWPIRKLEELPQGWGVLADDLLAGVFGAVLLHICVWLWPGR